MGPPLGVKEEVALREGEGGDSLEEPCGELGSRTRWAKNDLGKAMGDEPCSEN